MLSGLAALMSLTACVLITPGDRDQRLDPDSDGVLWPDDCDDHDDQVGSQEWFEDRDGDGYGTRDRILLSCEDPGYGWSEHDYDCDDDNGERSPAEKEVCDKDDLDNDCDGLSDDDDPDVVISVEAVYADADGDGFFDRDSEQFLCDPPSDLQPERESHGWDCDDTEALVNPAGNEIPNGRDDDCDNSWDEGAVYFVSDQGGTMEIWRASTGFDDAHQVTHLADEFGAARPPRVTPDGRYLAWVSSQQRLMIYRVPDGQIVASAVYDGISTYGLAWRQDAEDSESHEVFFGFLDKPEIHAVKAGAPSQSSLVWKRNSEHALLSVELSPVRQEALVVAATTEDCAATRLFLVNLTNGEFSEQSAPVDCDLAPPRWHPIERWASLTRDGASGTATLVEVNMTSGDEEVLLKLDQATTGSDTLGAWGPYAAPYSRDGNSLYPTVIWNGRAELWEVSPDAGWISPPHPGGHGPPLLRRRGGPWNLRG